MTTDDTADPAPHGDQDTPANGRQRLTSLAISALWVVATFTFACGACFGKRDDDDQRDAAYGPPPPERVAVQQLGNGALITWIDPGDTETNYAILRRAEGETLDTIVEVLDADTTEYHDAPLTPGVTYYYVVFAGNDDGETAAPEIEFTMK